MTGLNGEVAIVTGGANGLGQTIATRMSEEGAAVALLDREEKGGQRVIGKLDGSGANGGSRAAGV